MVSFLGFSLFWGISWSSLLFSVSLLTLGYLHSALLKSLRAGSELPLGSLQLRQTVPDSVCPNACVGVLCPWPPRVLGEAPLCVLLLGCRGLRVRPWLFRFSSALSISLAWGSGVCVWGSAFSLLEANSPLYSMKMPHSHLPSPLHSVVKVLSWICSQIGE